MLITPSLKKLCALFPCPLYVVGGAVRDFIMGSTVSDVDLSAGLTATEVVELLKDTEFIVKPHSLKLGTLGIKVGSESYEYTAFRVDSYGSDGSHAPQEVKFTSSVEQDALRRDFTVNALYYDIATGKILDFLGGLDDIKNKIIRTVRKPELVIKEDALRILRMVRFSAKLGYDIDAETLKVAKERVSSLKTIAVERIREEFNQILIADTYNGVKDAQIRGLELLMEIGAMDYIVPELVSAVGVKQNPRYHVYDVWRHLLESVRCVRPKNRLVALLHDVAKPICQNKSGSMRGHNVVGAQMARHIMSRLTYSKAETERTARLVEAHMFDLKGTETDEAVRLFVLNNRDIVLDLIDLKNADYTAHGMNEGENPSAVRLRDTYNKMLSSNVAFNVKDLPIDGEDLIALGVAPQERSVKLNTALEHFAQKGVYPTREEALEYIKQ